MKKLFISILSILLCSMAQSLANEADNKPLNDTSILGNLLKKEEYPDSSNVAPFTTDIEESSNPENMLIQGGVEKIIDLNLEECLRIALGNNPRIKEAMEDILIADSKVSQVWSNYFPTLSWQTGYSRIKQLQLSDAIGRNLIFNYFVLGQISASQMLYDFGVTQNQATIQKLDREAFKINMTAVVNDVVYRTKDAYYKLLYAYDAKRVTEEMVDKYEMFYNQAKAFYQIGVSPKVDVTIAEVNLSNAKLQLIQADNNVNLAIAGLNNVMGVPFIDKYTVNERLSYKPTNITMNIAYDIAKEARPELKLADIRVQAADQGVKLAKKAYFPQLMVEGQYQIGGKTFTSNYGYNLGGYLNFPQINGMKIKHQIREAKSSLDKEVATARGTQNDIYLEIQNAFLTLYEKKNQLPVAFLTVKQAKENYDLSYGRYKVGAGNPTELKDAQVAYKDAQLTYYGALYQYNSAKALLEKVIGQNIQEDYIELNTDYIQ